MQSKTAYPDWRDAAAYTPLLDADRSLFAWEWLRRDSSYRAAAERSVPGRWGMAEASSAAERFGLIAFEAPHLTVPDARPLWRSDVHPFVLQVDLSRAASLAADDINVGLVRDLARIIAGGAAEHLLLSDGLRSIRLDGPSGAFTNGPACLRYLIQGLASARPPLLTLRRLFALCSTGHFSRALHRREVRARRWIMTLRTHDALIAGADQRQIAEELLSRSVAEPCWRNRESSVRSQAQRLARCARRLAAGEYRKLLR